MRAVKRLLVIGVANNYGQGIVKGIHSYLSTHGRWEYWLEPDNSPESALRADLAIRQWKAKGIIACMQNRRIEDLVKASKLPAVNVTGDSAWTGPAVISDCAQVGKMVARHFLERGLRNFAFSARTGGKSSQKMSDGFETELRNAGHKCAIFEEQQTGRPEIDWVANHGFMRRTLAKLPKPVGIMCIYDYRAHEVARACSRHGFRVPDDVAIVGVGNQETLCRLSAPPLSSVELDCERIGHNAARLLVRMLAGTKPLRSQILVPARRFITRQSSDIIAIENHDIALAMRYIRDHACEPFSVKELLSIVPTSRRVMERGFEKLVGRTPKAEIMRLRIEHAKQLLQETDLAISAVAAHSGFAGQEIFSAAFHREVGKTPTKYRKSAVIPSMKALP